MQQGFIFYTNYESEKGKSIIAHPKVSLSFHWAGAERQVIIKGKAEKIAVDVSDGYFESRPRGVNWALMRLSKVLWFQIDKLWKISLKH